MGKTRMGACAVFACVGLLAGCSANAGSSESSEAVSQTGEAIVGGTAATAYPEAAYLNIDANATSVYLCSASLIAPKVVLTAGHCVDTHKSWEIHVGSQTRTSTSAATYDWNEKGAESVNPNHHDIGLVFLDQPIAITTYPTIATTKSANGTKVIDVGRVSSGTMTNSLYAATATVTDGSTVGYPLDYTSTDLIQPGDSGGPDFLSGTHTIVSVNSGAGGGIEVLARVDLIASWITGEIASHGGMTIPPQEPACAGGTVEKEANDTYATANALAAGTSCGLLTAADQDWFAASFGPGSITVSLAATGDATLAVGEASGSTCVASISGLTSVSLSAKAAQKACFLVSSASKSVQTYTLTLAAGK